ncbi:MAG TPA: EAL domain-containing protein [Acidimicrobiales bacterium]|nr:EAL domain-containing protein [Acidimicrobiales bacterium]
MPGCDCSAIERARTKLLIEPEGAAVLRRRHILESDLPMALRRDQFHIAYQPIYDLADLSLLGFEALLRWNHPTLGVVGPEEFIPLLEATGHIVEVGRFVLCRASCQLADWHRFQPQLTMAVNISSRQIDDADFVDHVRRALHLSGVDPGSLTVEITETTLMADVEKSVDRLNGLKALGVQIAIDDFGTGRSDLADLRRFPVDCLKIDRSLTRNLSASSDADAAVHHLRDLGQRLGWRMIAEGIETMAQVDHLRGEFVEEAQGFLFSKPLPPEEILQRCLSAPDLYASPER